MQTYIFALLVFLAFLKNICCRDTCTYARIITAGAVSITNAVSITTAPYAAVFSVLNNFFRLFSFFVVNFKQIHTRNKKKKFEKKFLTSSKNVFKK